MRIRRGAALIASLIAIGSASAVPAAADSGDPGRPTFTLDAAQRAIGPYRGLTSAGDRIAVVRDAHGTLAVADTALAQDADPSIRAMVAATSSYVDLSWAPVRGATSFTIIRNGAAVGSTTGTSWRDTSVSPGATIDYIITSEGASGDAGGRTWGLTAHVPASDTTSQDVTAAAQLAAAATAYTTTAV